MEAPSHFQSTLWSQVLLAAREPRADASQKALDALCRAYWYPIYAHIRRSGFDSVGAQDLTQGFFEHILGTGFLDRADASRGRFRNYLMGALWNYLANERERRMARRRGGGQVAVPLDTASAEDWLAGEASHANDATRAFDRSWAVSVIGGAIATLQHEQEKAGKTDHFSVLKEFLQRAPVAGEYESVAARLGLTKGAVAAAVHRLNERLGELVRRSVRETLTDPSMADEEMRFLYAALHD